MVTVGYTHSGGCQREGGVLWRVKLRPEVSKKFKGLKLLVTVTVNLRIEVEV